MRRREEEEEEEGGNEEAGLEEACSIRVPLILFEIRLCGRAPHIYSRSRVRLPMWPLFMQNCFELNVYVAMLRLIP